MILQIECPDEVHRRIENVPWLAPAVKSQQQCDETRHDSGVADRPEIQALVPFLGHKPDLRLAAADAVGVSAQLIGKFGQAATKIDEVLVAIHPVVEKAEFLDDLPLCRGDFAAHYPPLRQVVPFGPSSIITPLSTNWSRMASAF